MHLGSNHEFSTFRRSIGAILAVTKGRKFIDENDLTEWMHLHLKVLVVSFEDADSLGKVEKFVLLEINPPLNLKGMPKTEIRIRLKELRKLVT